MLQQPPVLEVKETIVNSITFLSQHLGGRGRGGKKNGYSVGLELPSCIMDPCLNEKKINQERSASSSCSFGRRFVCEAHTDFVSTHLLMFCTHFILMELG